MYQRTDGLTRPEMRSFKNNVGWTNGSTDRHFDFIFELSLIDILLVHEKFRHDRNTGYDFFRRSKITQDGRTDGRTERRTCPLVGMRCRI